MIWTEKFFGAEDDENYTPSIFKTKKTNLPKNYKPPPPLKTFLNGVKSELKDPLNRNKSKSNLTSEEQSALDELIRLQRERKIVIKPCDKGAGIIILDFDDYLASCYNHLGSTQTQEDGSQKNFYSEVTGIDLGSAKDEILDVLKTALKDGLITKEEFNHMDPSNKGPGKFYELFKVHKKHQAGRPPPERPIISTCGSYTENIGKYVQNTLKRYSNIHNSYLQDSPDFLRFIEELNESGAIEEDDIIVTVDVSALYTNIQQDEGIEAVRNILDAHNDDKAHNCFILELLELILKHNIFEFDEKLYRQDIGTAMGSKPAPDYANIFMATIDDKIAQIAENHFEVNPIKFFKRFLDDIFIIFKGTNRKLHSFLNEINKISNSIKFTMEHTTRDKCDECDCHDVTSIPFLDTQCQIENNKIIVDLYKKPTDRNMYLLPSSCHPNSITKNIPYSLALRIVRICSKTTTRDQRLSELREMLLDRDYKASIVDAAIVKAKAVDRSEALKRVYKPKTTKRPVFVVRHDPRLPSVAKIVNKHWRTMTQDPYMAEVYPEPPLVAHSRPQNIRDKLIRAKLPSKARKKRVIPGMHKCKKQNCKICPWVVTNKVAKATHTDKVVHLSKEYNCQTSNLVYLVQCKKCKDQYIGETKHTLEHRFNQHLGYVRRKETDKATGDHFNKKGHQISDMTITVLEGINSDDPFYRLQREHFWIEKFNVLHKGMNGKR